MNLRPLSATAQPGLRPIGELQRQALSNTQPSPGITTTVNAGTFGAKGDGATDDTQAIQSALDALAADGGTLVLPAGTYVISQTLRLNRTSDAPFNLRGALGGVHPVTRLFWRGGEAEAVLSIENARRAEITDLVIHGDSQTRAVVRILPSGDQIRIRRCIFTWPKPGADSAALELGRREPLPGDNMSEVTVEDCELDAGTLGNGASALRVRESWLCGLTVERCTLRNGSRGLMMVHNGSVSVRRCMFQALSEEAVFAHDTLVSMDACQVFDCGRLIRVAGSATVSAVLFQSSRVPDDGVVIEVPGRLQLLGSELTDWRGRVCRIVLHGGAKSLFTRGNRFRASPDLPVWVGGAPLVVNGALDIDPPPTGAGPHIDCAGDVNIPSAGDWHLYPAVLFGG